MDGAPRRRRPPLRARSRTSTGCSQRAPARAPAARLRLPGRPERPGRSTYELLVGPDLLAAPVAGPGDDAERLPAAGLVGRPLHRRDRARAAASFTRATPLDQFPLYARAGAVVPVQPPHATGSWWGVDELTHPGRAGFLATNGADARPDAASRTTSSSSSRRRRGPRRVTLGGTPVRLDAGTPGRCPASSSALHGPVVQGTDRALAAIGFTLMSRAAEPCRPTREDVRSARPYLLRRSPLDGVRAARGRASPRSSSIDITGLDDRPLPRARAARARPRSEADPLEPALGRRERLAAVPGRCCCCSSSGATASTARASCARAPGRSSPSVVLVAALDARVRDRHEPALHDLRPLRRRRRSSSRRMISLLRWSYETVTGSLLRSLGVRRRVLLVGDADQVAHLRATLGASRERHRLRVRRAMSQPGPELARGARGESSSTS